jgi:hypothetical protein
MTAAQGYSSGRLHAVIFGEAGVVGRSGLGLVIATTIVSTLAALSIVRRLSPSEILRES